MGQTALKFVGGNGKVYELTTLKLMLVRIQPQSPPSPSSTNTLSSETHRRGFIEAWGALRCMAPEGIHWGFFFGLWRNLLPITKASEPPQMPYRPSFTRYFSCVFVFFSLEVAPMQFAPKPKDESNKLRRKNSLYEAIVEYLDALDGGPSGVAALVDSCALRAAAAADLPEPSEDPRLAGLNQTADLVRAGDLRALRGVITNHFKTINRRCVRSRGANERRIIKRSSSTNALSRAPGARF